ncbi:MAG: hypothetical protein EP343_02580 [Deltaproteobacteria bacterium]|nr:MAG: hypothetical protein EP343_02580 [Deltaproteobacteria bacterium]
MGTPTQTATPTGTPTQPTPTTPQPTRTTTRELPRDVVRWVSPSTPARETVNARPSETVTPKLVAIFLAPVLKKCVWPIPLPMSRLTRGMTPI